LDVSWNTESTTQGSYSAETSADTNTELAVSDANSSWVLGGGVNFALGSRLVGSINIGTVNSRDDYNESFASGGLAIRF